ncbi:MAG: hypothetical protein H6642_02640 [Caldilineaceae bacterium]|nr:hypothetical protein [Caldilineaceae bacterium]
MIPLTAAVAVKEETNPWMSALYAGVFTAVAAAITVFAFVQTQNWIVGVLVHLLTGAAAVLGYQMARGRMGSSWGAVLGGLIGGIPIIFFLLWPILVGALDKSQSIGRLLLGSILGAIIGVAVFLLLGSFMGQNPAWVGTGFTFLMAFWAGTVGAFAAS